MYTQTQKSTHIQGKVYIFVYKQICLCVYRIHPYLFVYASVCSYAHSPQQAALLTQGPLLTLTSDKSRHGSLAELILILLLHCFYNYVAKKSCFCLTLVYIISE